MRRFAIALLSSAVLLAASATHAFEDQQICRFCGRAHALDARQFEPEGNDAASGRKYAPDRVVDMLHLKIDVVPNFAKGTVAGTTSLTFAPISKPVSEIKLNAVRLDVEKITGDIRIADTVVTDESITILFAKPLAVGKKATVHITYTAEPKKGLYFRTPKLGYAEGDTHIWTQGETHEARHWFPCFDFPNEKSSTEVICTVPSDMTVLSNGKLMSDKENKVEETRTVRWLQEKPHVVYLVCLVAGYFDTLEDRHEDTPLHFHSQPSLSEHADNSFADTRMIMDFFEKEIGYEYPWVKYDQVTILDFTSGGMENTTLTTLYHRTIFPDAWENIKTSRDLDAHEMAHQWFGDLVTCEDWSHLWLNEGFATYYTHLYNGHRLGHDELLFGLWEDAKGRVLPQANDTKPIVWREYKGAWDQFDYRAYPKGSWVLHMLRNYLGEDIYRAAIKKYLQEHEFTSVVTPDLIDALENESGKELDQFFDQWVYHPGNPQLKIAYSWNAKQKLANVSVEQTQSLKNGALIFAFPTKLRFWVDGKPVDHEILIDDKKQDFTVPLDKQPTSVRFDPEYTVLAQIDFNKPMPMLLEQLKRDDDIIGRLLALDAIAKKNDAKSLEALKERLNNDPHYGVRKAAAKVIAGKKTDDALDMLVDSREQTDARVRQEVIRGIARFYRPKAQRVLMHTIDAEKNPLIVAEALKGLGKFGGDAVQEKIEEAMTRKSFANVIASAAFTAAGDLADPDLKVRALRVVKANLRDFSDRNTASALSVIGKLWKDADDTTPAREFLEECLFDPSRSVRRAAVSALGALGDPKVLPALKTLSSTEVNGRDTAAVKRAIEQIEKARDTAPQGPKELAELRKLVVEMQKKQAELEKQLKEVKEQAPK